MTRSLLCVAVLFSGLSSVAAEEEEKKKKTTRGPGKLLEALDANGDGKVTQDEVPQRRQRFFARALRQVDSNGDKALDAAELAQLGKTDRPERRRAGRRRKNDRSKRNPRPTGLFQLLDRNRDGELTQKELARAPRLLRRLDRNGDGRLSRREITAVGSDRPQQSDKVSRRRRLKRLDLNKDGFLSKDEVKGRLAEAFARLDRNGDGKLGPAELRAVQSDRRPKREKPLRRRRL